MPMTTMAAIRAHRRGGPEVLVYEQAPRPAPGPGDALLQVRAVGITKDELTWPETWTSADGRDRLPVIPGREVSGVVVELGARASRLTIGEEVYGRIDDHRDGATAEYVAVRAADLAPKPRSLDHAHAAALPLAAVTAWQGLFDHAGLSAGQRVLVQGAGGGVGAFVVQLAKWAGARVIATATARQLDLVRQLGADRVLDGRADPFQELVSDVDVVFDTLGGDMLARSWSCVQRGGVVVSIVERLTADIAAAHGVRGVYFIVKPDRAQLIRIAQLVDEGRLRVVLDDVFPLAEARAAYEKGLRGGVSGKLVLRVGEQGKGGGGG
jgi:NADPH:quinone reductase-like Zn-dependent oxidoreductase